MLEITDADLTPKPGHMQARARIYAAGERRQREMAAPPPIEVKPDNIALSTILAKHLALAVDQLPNTSDATPDARQILSEVAAKHGMSVLSLRSRSWPKARAAARQEACYRLYAECAGMNTVSIGRYVGGRDHTTVIYSIRIHARRSGLPVPKRPRGG